MTERPQSNTLAAALPREMVRVAVPISTYRSVDNDGLAAVLSQLSTDRSMTGLPRCHHPLLNHHVDDLTYRGIGVRRRRRGRLLLNSDRDGLLDARRNACPCRLHLSGLEHRKVVVCRNANHGARLHSTHILRSSIKRGLNRSIGNLYFHKFSVEAGR